VSLPETERLSFRTWSADDLPLALALWGDPEVTALIDARGRLSSEQVQAKLERERQCLESSGVQYWPMFEKGSGAFVGCCGLRPWTYSVRGQGCLEIGFHLVKAQWGRGFAEEAARGVIAHARGPLAQARLMAGHHPKNEASKRVLGKLGFVLVEAVFFPPTGLSHPAYELTLT
jgi:RimJ/RimL family protein N-acetyltransferase